jgi:TIR domain
VLANRLHDDGLWRELIAIIELDRFDAFLSFAWRDRKEAEALQKQLALYGIRCITADPSAEVDEAALAGSRHLVLVLSPDYIDSRWPGIDIALQRSGSSEAWRERTLPLLLRPCVIPGYLRSFTPIPWSTEVEQRRHSPELLRSLQEGMPVPGAPEVPRDELMEFAKRLKGAPAGVTEDPNFRLGVRRVTGSFLVKCGLYVLAFAVALLLHEVVLLLEETREGRSLLFVARRFAGLAALALLFIAGGRRIKPRWF